MPADGEGAAEAMHALALCQIFQEAADDGAEAFAAAVAEYGAPAVLAGGESDGIDVSAYGFSVAAHGTGVMAELEGLTSQVKAMEEKVGVHLSQVSLVGDEDAHAVHAPASALYAGSAMGDILPRQAVPHEGGASAGGAPAGMSFHMGVPTEEFPGGVELVPVRHRVPSVAVGPAVSAVACSFGQTDAPPVAPESNCGYFLIDEFLDNATADIVRSGFTLCGIMRGGTWLCFCGARSAGGGLRCSTFWGAASYHYAGMFHWSLGFWDRGQCCCWHCGQRDLDNDNIYNSVTTETPVMCMGQVCVYSGFDTLSPVVQDRLLLVVGSALAAGEPVDFGGGLAAAALVVWCMVVSPLTGGLSITGCASPDCRCTAFE
ncbi:hypothetical protein CYMTET_46494 [Cymbomonas tetramitiformis]|uniref:Uncharacterized protein n=1 Tax=Cymbomonas tetramitiformis TaxID=36881 RepID=A0AAE0BW13_9CHLO|nr:hypothetical protein CYMTET_46494 [Cymbomonas tetramitiformis]